MRRNVERKKAGNTNRRGFMKKALAGAAGVAAVVGPLSLLSGLSRQESGLGEGFGQDSIFAPRKPKK